MTSPNNAVVASRAGAENRNKTITREIYKSAEWNIPNTLVQRGAFQRRIKLATTLTPSNLIMTSHLPDLYRTDLDRNLKTFLKK